MQGNDRDYRCKVVLVGDSGAGKSCLLLHFATGEYREAHFPTIGVEFGYRKLRLDVGHLGMGVWDCAGQASFRAVTRPFYRGAAGALLVFDVTQRGTFDHVRYWVEQLRSVAYDSMSIALVGNKSDLPREVTRKEAWLLCADLGLTYRETSAKTGDGVHDCFVALSMDIMQALTRKTSDGARLPAGVVLCERRRAKHHRTCGTPTGECFLL